MTTPLAGLIRAEIERDGPITFARFMELALYEPRLGYYRQPADRPTDWGDFLTAPEAHAIFGWTVARRIEEMWAALGNPRPFTMVEYGAGSGTLALSILDGFRRHGSPALEAVRYRPVESNPHRLADLDRRFEAAGLADRMTADRRPDGRLADGNGDDRLAEGNGEHAGIVLANEFLDALPVHRVTVRDGELRELFVVVRDTGPAAFAEEARPPSTGALAERLEADGVALEEGQVAEICLGIGPWLDDVAATLDRGYLLAIDYGYEAEELYGARHRAGTLLGYKGHDVVDHPFRDPGTQDLTAHVDFTALQREAAARGFAPHSLATQAEFLTGAGLADELRAMQRDPATTMSDYLRARSAVVRMLDPRAMGRFRVFVAARNAPALEVVPAQDIAPELDAAPPQNEEASGAPEGNAAR